MRAKDRFSSSQKKTSTSSSVTSKSIEARGSKRVKTKSRGSKITTDMVGLTFRVQSGMRRIPIYVTENMVGHKFTEFAPPQTLKGRRSNIATKEAATQDKNQVEKAYEIFGNSYVRIIPNMMPTIGFKKASDRKTVVESNLGETKTLEDFLKGTA